MGLIRKNILLRYLLSYLIVLLVPILVFGVVFDRFFISLYRDEVIEQNRLSLERTRNSFDSQTAQLVSIAAQFSSQPSLSLTNIRSNPTAYIQIIRVLGGFDYANDFIDGITYYNLDVPGIIYTRSGTYNPLYYPTYEIGGQNESFSIEEMLISLTDPVWICRTENRLPEGSYSGVHLEYAMAVPDIDNAYVIFRLSQSGIDDIIFGSLDDTAGQTLVLDGYGQQLYPKMPADAALLGEVRGHVSSESSQSFSYLTSADEYLLQTHSDITGLTYVRLVPAAAMLGEVIHRQNLFRTLLICLVLVGGSVVYLMALTHARPIRRLSLLVESSVQGLPGQLDGIQKAQLAIRKLKERSNQLEKENRRVQRERLLLRLIRGKYAALSDFNRDAAPLDLTIGFSRMRVALLYGCGRTESGPVSVPESVIPEDLLGGEYRVYAIEYLEQNSLILLINYDREAPASLREVLTAACAALSESMEAALRFAVGGPCATAPHVFDSYMQAMAAVKSEPGTCSRDCVLLYDEISHMDRSYAYPQEELDALYAALTGAKADKVSFIHDVLINTIRENYPNRFVAAALCYDVINTYLRAMDALKRPYREMGDKYAGYMGAEGVMSIDTLIDVLHRIHDDAVDFLESVTRDEPNDMNRIMGYIQQHYREPDFCVGALAGSFDMSVSNLSHQFKAQTGCNVSDYINHLKIDYAKEMLRGTGLPISEISLRLGYIRTSSFIRKFKQHENMTPGEYRAAFADQERIMNE